MVKRDDRLTTWLAVAAVLYCSLASIINAIYGNDTARVIAY